MKSCLNAIIWDSKKKMPKADFKTQKIPDWQ